MLLIIKSEILCSHRQCSNEEEKDGTYHPRKYLSSEGKNLWQWMSRTIKFYSVEANRDAVED